MNGLSILDIGLLVFFMFFIIKGYNSGFVRQTSTLLGLLVALIMAVNYFLYLEEYLRPYLNVSPTLLQFISFAIIFILCNVVIHLLGMMVKRILDLLFLDPLDHIAGAFFGLVKGGVIAYFLVIFLTRVPHQQVEQIVNSSLLANNLLEITPALYQTFQDLIPRP